MKRKKKQSFGSREKTWGEEASSKIHIMQGPWTHHICR